MAYNFDKLRCPRCGEYWNLQSRDEVTGSSSSYSFGKGLVGAALLGPVGAVAGIGGKHKTHTEHKLYRVCPKCGYSEEVI